MQHSPSLSEEALPSLSSRTSACLCLYTRKNSTLLSRAPSSLTARSRMIGSDVLEIRFFAAPVRTGFCLFTSAYSSRIWLHLFAHCLTSECALASDRENPSDETECKLPACISEVERRVSGLFAQEDRRSERFTVRCSRLSVIKPKTDRSKMIQRPFSKRLSHPGSSKN